MKKVVILTCRRWIRRCATWNRRFNEEAALARVSVTVSGSAIAQKRWCGAAGVGMSRRCRITARRRSGMRTGC
jgi:peroxiredoxin